MLCFTCIPYIFASQSDARFFYLFIFNRNSRKHYLTTALKNFLLTALISARPQILNVTAGNKDYLTTALKNCLLTALIAACCLLAQPHFWAVDGPQILNVYTSVIIAPVAAAVQLINCGQVVATAAD